MASMGTCTRVHTQIHSQLQMVMKTNIKLRTFVYKFLCAHILAMDLSARVHVHTLALELYRYMSRIAESHESPCLTF